MGGRRPGAWDHVGCGRGSVLTAPAPRPGGPAPGPCPSARLWAVLPAAEWAGESQCLGHVQRVYPHCELQTAGRLDRGVAMGMVWWPCHLVGEWLRKVGSDLVFVLGSWCSRGSSEHVGWDGAASRLSHVPVLPLQGPEFSSCPRRKGSRSAFSSIALSVASPLPRAPSGCGQSCQVC